MNMKKPIYNQQVRADIREIPDTTTSQVSLLKLEVMKAGREVMAEFIPYFEKIVSYIPGIVVKKKYQRYCKNSPE